MSRTAHKLLMTKVADDFEVEQSIILEDDSTSYLSRTPSSASNQKTWTWSGWIKRGNITTSASQQLFSAYDNSSGNNATWLSCYFRGSSASDTDALSVSAWDTNYRITSRLFRDSAAWYHVVVAYDTTQATADNRVKIYINGVQETSFATKNNPAQNFDGAINSTVEHRLGSVNYSAAPSYFDGYMAEVHFIDGTALTPSSFGQAGTALEWVPKEVKSVTYGTNGFYLKFIDSYPGLVAATGGTITTDGDYKVHTFNSSGTFTVTSTSGGDAAVDFLVIAGGGGGGGYAGGGGGGAGGYRTSYGPSGGGAGAELPLVVTAQAYTVTVGAGGTAATGWYNNGSDYGSSAGGQGANSVFSSITSIGGGGGGASGGSKPPTTGGSGGGGTVTTSYNAGAAGTANQGYAGGNGSVVGSNSDIGGGGGGAGSVGETGTTSTTSGDGGSGVASSITGSSVTRAGGGGGAGYTSGYRGEGQHGGGDGASTGETPAAGTANTGGGGGARGGAWSPAAAGGSGVVIIRYKFQ